MKKIISILLICSSLILSACGKNNVTVEEPAVQVARNDWYGAITRASDLSTDAENVVSMLDDKNYNIIMGNPQDYWSSGYYHFTFLPIESRFINYTLYLNETDDWEIVSANTQAKVLEKEPDAGNILAIRNNENDYTIQWDGYDTFSFTNTTEYMYRTLNLTYDGNHNWAQMIEKSKLFQGPELYEEDFYEYAEIDSNHFAIQTQKGRLLAEYDENGTLVKMYYSKLSDEPRVESVTEEINTTEETEIIEEEVSEEETTDDSETKPLTLREMNPYVYNSEDDSMFKVIDTLNFDWVMAEPTVEQYVIYENEVLMFRVKNKLTGNYEGFIVSNDIAEPVFDEESGLYYDPTTGLPTTQEEYQNRLNKINEQTIIMNEIINNENIKVKEQEVEIPISETENLNNEDSFVDVSATH